MDSDEGTSVDAPSSGASGALTSQLLANSGLMEAFGGHLQELVGSKSSYIDSMPQPMKNRIKALKNIQVQYTQLEAKFYEEVQALERKYTELHQPTYAKRRQIIAGDYEPTEEETVLGFDEEDDDEEDGDMDEEDAPTGAKIMDVDENGDPIEPEVEEGASAKVEKVKYDDTTTGIPEFWLQSLKNADVIAELIEEADEPLLRHLVDIELKHYEEPMGFDLIFHFSENPFINNKSLVKHYNVKIEVDDEAPFQFQGPQITGCTGCEVNWKKGHNLTVKTIKKKQKGKGKGQPGKTITKQVPANTFFSYFSPPAVPEADEETDEFTEEQEDDIAILGRDYEVASFIRDSLIPKAVLVFTGVEGGDDDDEGMGLPFLDGLDGEAGMQLQQQMAAGGGRPGGLCASSLRGNTCCSRRGCQRGGC